jgi:hypothetical protein
MMYFELRAAPSGPVTHAAALEFTAAEGTIGLPPLLASRLAATPLLPSQPTITPADSHKLEQPHATQQTTVVQPTPLPWATATAAAGNNMGQAADDVLGYSDALGRVDVRYVRMAKGVFARLQPVAHRFHKEVEDMRGVLEAELMLHSTLTEGDRLTVRHEGVSHELVVLQLQPHKCVSVIDTDMEVSALAYHAAYLTPAFTNGKQTRA